MAEARAGKTKEEVLKDFRTGEIVQAARRVIGELGFADASMERIAHEAGVSKGTIYLYFRNKEDHFHEIARHAAARLMALTDACVEMPDASIARDDFARAYVDFALGQPHLYRVMANVDLMPYIADRTLEAPGRRLADRYRDLYARGIAAGQIRDANPEYELMIDWSLLHGFVSNVLSGAFPPPRLPSVTVTELRDVIVDAIRARTSIAR
jgi:AcrR family transcriptional regulator